MTAVHEMLVALSVDVTVSFSKHRRIVVEFGIIDVRFIFTPSLSSILSSFAFHTHVSATAVQLNSATPLTETLTACGGMVISAMFIDQISMQSGSDYMKI